MNWPIYYKEKLHIANPTSNVGIVTLWTPMQAILPNLDQNEFNIGGQLYSKVGVNYIIRNILANPVIDTLIVCGANRSGSADALINFIEKGVDKENAVIGVDKANIDKEIDKESLELFRKKVKVVKLLDNSSHSKVSEELKKVSKKNSKSWSEAKTFPEPEKKETDKFPSEKSTFTIRTDYIKEAWPQILRHIMRFGSKKGMIKVGEIRELVNLVTVIEKEDPNKPDIPDWFTFSKDDLKLYYKGFFEKVSSKEDYGYGARMFSHPLGIPNEKYKSPNNTKESKSYFKKLGKLEISQNDFVLNQIEEVYLKLKNYKYDRGAMISIWNPWVDNVVEGWMSDNSTKSGNVPCMTQLQFAYREHKLFLTAYFRSNDMFDAWPRNAFALRKLQYDLAKKLDMSVGSLTTISSLAQIYEPNYEEANKLLVRFNNITMCRTDQRGAVIIEIDGKDIVCTHMDASGNEELEQFRINGMMPKAAQRMSDILLTNLVFSEMPHAMDIARELQKAELAVKNGLIFKQDQELKI